MTREDVLTQARNIVCKDRERQYGTPEDSFKDIAHLWNSYLYDDPTDGITPEDVAIMMALLKVARIKSGKFKEDSYIDLAGYAACAGEIASRKHSNPINNITVGVRTFTNDGDKMDDEWDAFCNRNSIEKCINGKEAKI